MRNKAAPKGKDLPSNQALKDEEAVQQFVSESNRNLDEMAVYDELFNGVLSDIREDIRKGAGAEEILSKYANLAAARVVTVALTDSDSGRGLSAAKDVLDRSMGRAVERKQIHHKLDKVEEKQLDAILLTELESLEIDEED